MAKYIVEGGNKLQGTIEIGGNKNSVLPCLAATLLTKESVTLKNVPNIVDVQVMLQMLEEIGAEVQQSGNTVTIRTPQIQNSVLSEELSSKLRASILLVGPLLARSNKAVFLHPGGDVIGKRSIHTHLQGFEVLGYQIECLERDKKYQATKSSAADNDIEFFMDEASVTATENLIMSSVIGNRQITIKNCACEPHVVDLCNLLNQMGAEIEGVGQSTLVIKAKPELGSAEFTIGADFVEMGTYAIAAAMTGGDVTLTNCTLKDMEPVTLHLSKMGLEFKEDDRGVHVSCQKILPTPKLHTNIWPGFPPDLMSPVISLGTQAEGVSLFHDWMYESRMFFVDKLILMGANITIADPHRVVVYGPTKLYGRNLETPDIRAGMALVIAALVAEGQSTINRAELIERGYPNAVQKLSMLGAKITRVD